MIMSNQSFYFTKFSNSKLTLIPTASCTAVPMFVAGSDLQGADGIRVK